MLIRLSIRDVVLIDTLDLSFETGIVTLTGETGAGKSILLDALGFALGARSDAGALRTGAAQASVAAAFDLPPTHPARQLAGEHGIDIEGEFILRRVIAADGRSRGFVNDQPCSVGLLKQLGALLVEIHGQFDTQGLLDAATHRGALDDFAAEDDLTRAVAQRHAAWRTAQAAEVEASETARRAAQEEAFLRHAVAELDALAPEADEEAALGSRRAMLAGGERLAEALNTALDDLSANKGVEASLRGAQRQLERLAPQMAGRLDAALAALDRAAVEAADAVAEVETLARTLDLDPAALEKTEERLFALKATARKHRVTIAELPALHSRFAEQLTMLDDGEARLVRLAAATNAARQAYAEKAEVLTQRRRAAAATLDKAVAKELPPLKLEKARFRTHLEPLAEDSWSAAGCERVVFEVATNPGSEPGPLGRIASGGELARFMLALKAVLARASDGRTLIFDELDSGVGGATAAAVGERLARLGKTLQVLVVTHSPQVAARGSQHFRVAKKIQQGRAIISVEQLAGEERREEIARMLSGATVTPAARAAAEELLQPKPSRRDKEAGP